MRRSRWTLGHRRAGLSALLLLAACSQDPPNPLSLTLERYDAGRAKLDAGDFAGAAVDFEAAAAGHPEAAELHLWRGRALAAAGDLPGAITAAGQALEIRGVWGLAHYNRACWRARAGELELAALDLQVAMETGEIDLLAAAADPDLDPLRADPRYRDGVPAPTLPADASAPSVPVFLGSEWTVTLRADVPTGAPLSISLQGEAPPMSWLRTVEDHRGDSQILEITFRVDGAGEGALGPWTLSAGGLDAEVGPLPYQFLAPADRPAPDAGALAVERALDPWSPPSLRLAGVALPGAGPIGGGLGAARAEPGDRVELGGEGRAIRYEIRRDGQPREQGALYLPPARPVTITRGGRVVVAPGG